MPSEPLQPRMLTDEPARSDPAAAASPARRAMLLHALQASLPQDTLLWQEAQLRPYECDGLTAFRQLPLAVILPKTEAQVRQALLICRSLEIPVVARGSGTGLSGGAMPHAGGV